MSDPTQPAIQNPPLAAQAKKQQAIQEIEAKSLSFVADHPLEIGIGVVAVLFTIFIVELGKQAAKVVWARRGWSKDTHLLIVLALPFIVGGFLAMLFRFPAHWEQLAGYKPHWLEGIVLGSIMTGGGSMVTYSAVHKFNLVGIARAGLHRFFNVSDERVRHIETTRSLPTITPEMKEADRKKRKIKDLEEDSE